MKQTLKPPMSVVPGKTVLPYTPKSLAVLRVLLQAFEDQIVTNGDSLPIPLVQAENAAVRLGNGAVLLSVQVLASQNSAACTSAPSIVFGKVEPMDSLMTSGATLPKW